MSETKSEELEVRSEELIKQLRHCAASSLQGCDTCPQRIEPDCMTIMLLSAADEIERLRAERVERREERGERREERS